MSRGKKQQPRKPWQRRANSSRHFQCLYDDLLDSPAFHDLTAREKVLLIFCRRESHGRAMAEGEHDERLFYMNKSLRTTIHELYKPSDTRQFEHDMAALIAHGFVDLVKSGYETRTKSLYRLSDRWNHWGTRAFGTPENVKTVHLQNEEAKAKRERLKTESTCNHAL